MLDFIDKIIKEACQSLNGVSTSEGEDYIYEQLKKKYKGIQRQYTADDFPYKADFYIPSENMIIEYSKHISHGRKKYDPDNKQHQEEVKTLKDDHSEFNDRIIHTWTEVDPEKVQVAEEAGYKYVVLYNMREFETWFENPELTYDEYKDPDPLIYDSDEYFRQKANGQNPNGN